MDATTNSTETVTVNEIASALGIRADNRIQLLAEVGRLRSVLAGLRWHLDRFEQRKTALDPS